MTKRTMTEWLANSHDRPDQVRAEWREHGRALLPIGRNFDVIRLPERLVYVALGTVGLSYAHTDFGLEENLGGPVIHDGHGRNYYAIVPAGTQAGTLRQWRYATLGVECLGPGTLLGVPAVGILEYDATHPIYWATLGGASRFCDPASVALLVRVGAALLAQNEGARPLAEPLVPGTERTSL